MVAKQTASKDNDAGDPYLESDKDPELEKKIDEMMSMDPVKELPTEPSPEPPKPEKPSKSKKVAIPVSEHKPETEPKPEAKADSEPAVDVEPDTDVMQVTNDFGQSEEKGSAPLLPDDLVAANMKDLDKSKEKAVEPDDAEPAEEPEITPEPASDTPLITDETEPNTETAETELAEAEKPAEASADVVDDLPVPGEKTADELGLEDVGTGHAVDEIIASEADELLEVRDHKVDNGEEVQASVKAKKSGGKKSLKAFFAAWWHSKRARNATLIVLLLAVAAATVIPTSRYFVLNTVGVRSAASITVLDETTGQPLKNAEFVIAQKSGKTDGEGTIKLTDLKLGPQTMTVKKAGFAEVSKPLTIGWGSNPLGEFRLKAVGNQYKINVADFLSAKPIAKVEASSGEANARANDKGEIVLTVPINKSGQEQIDVQLTGEGLRTENITLTPGKQEVTKVTMVPSSKHVFISKRSGKYDLYKIDVDGKNEEKVLAGTGSERPDGIAVSVHPTKNIAALVSARDTSRNKDGFVLSSLNIIDLSNNKATQIAQSERIQMVGWVDNKLTYVKIAEGESAASPNRHRLISYDLATNTEKELASTNYFNDILMVNKSIYYTPASYNVNGTVGLFKTNADGTDKKTVYDKEVWNLFRTAYDKMSVSVGQDWFDLNLNTDVLTRATSAPPVLKTRVYVNRPDDSASLWTDERDGKGVLLNYELGSKADTILRSQSGLKNPIRWLTDKTIIYRVSNNQETADYVVNIEGGEPHKISDVTDTAGIDRWYYY